MEKGKETKKGMHRAWVIMIACCFLMMTLALATTIMGFFIQAVSGDLGFDRSAFSLYITLAGIAGMIAMPIWGRVAAKIGVRKMVLIAGACCSVFIALLGFCNSLPMFYIAGACMGATLVGTNVLPTSILINTWFDEKRGFAMGVAMAFSGVAGTIFSPIVSGVINGIGWQTGYFLVAVLMLVFTVPVALLLIKDSPAQMGLTPYGAKETSEQASTEEVAGVPAGRAFKSLAFIALGLAILLINAVGGVLQNLSGHITNLGIDPASAAMAISVITFTLIFSKIVLGMINDKFGVSAATIISFALLAAGCALFAFANDFTMVLVSAVVYGLGASCLTVMAPLITGKMFGQRDYSSIYSVIGSLASLGLAIGVPLIALNYDVAGNYVVALLVCAVIMVISIFLVLYALAASKKLWNTADKQESVQASEPQAS